MPLDTLPDATQEPLKRGPGRPRKQRPASPEPAPVDTEPRVISIDRRVVKAVTGKSISTIKRLEKSDPDWPTPFAIGGHARNNYLLRDIEAYLLKKAADAQAAALAGPQPERGTRTNQSRPAKAKATETA
ncbi:hypothetical protein [Caballeronia mineralivorans]|jgi:hypothetical protein|uniref:hypothetical protein n=1 Tax=Caballeronia mineralivorans TaxID=2010198 RepID=UPI0023EFF367|nr:hypothetical protein [Caballeronia mineralivorans]MDB5788213.1 hypothetical protein [Caballeronia mineralivorans]